MLAGVAAAVVALAVAAPAGVKPANVMKVTAWICPALKHRPRRRSHVCKFWNGTSCNRNGPGGELGWSGTAVKCQRMSLQVSPIRTGMLCGH